MGARCCWTHAPSWLRPSLVQPLSTAGWYLHRLLRVYRQIRLYLTGSASTGINRLYLSSQVDWFLDPTLPPVGPEGLAAFVNELQPFERSGWGPEDPYFDGAAALGVDWLTARVVAFSREGRFELLLWMASPDFESHYSQVSRLLTHLDHEGFIANESELEIERAGMFRPHLVMDDIFEIGQTSTMDQEAYQRHLRF